eukprot:SM006917S20510  [mRNA]  locus=s6917:63:462:+ [translate_table: standard]
MTAPLPLAPPSGSASSGIARAAASASPWTCSSPISAGPRRCSSCRRIRCRRRPWPPPQKAPARRAPAEATAPPAAMASALTRCCWTSTPSG